MGEAGMLVRLDWFGSRDAARRDAIAAYYMRSCLAAVVNETHAWDRSDTITCRTERTGHRLSWIRGHLVADGKRARATTVVNDAGHRMWDLVRASAVSGDRRVGRGLYLARWDTLPAEVRGVWVAWDVETAHREPIEFAVGLDYGWDRKAPRRWLSARRALAGVAVPSLDDPAPALLGRISALTGEPAQVGAFWDHALHGDGLGVVAGPVEGGGGTA